MGCEGTQAWLSVPFSAAYADEADRTRVFDWGATPCSVSAPEGHRTRTRRGGFRSLQPKKHAAADCDA